MRPALEERFRNFEEHLNKRFSEQNKSLAELKKNMDEQNKSIADLNKGTAQQNKSIAQQNKKMAKQDKKLEDRAKEIEMLKEMQMEGEMMWGRPFIVNLAEQILLVAAGKPQGRRAREPFHRFRDMAGSHKLAPRLSILRREYESESFESTEAFAAALDEYLRHSVCCTSGFEELETDAALAKRLLGRNALLRAQCALAAATVDAFPLWRREFGGSNDTQARL